MFVYYPHDKYLILNYLIANKLNLLTKELKKHTIKFEIDQGDKNSRYFKSRG